MDNCTLDCIEVLGNYTQEGMCDFVQQYCVQDTVQIVQGYYCLINSSFMILSILSVFVLLMVYYSMNIATDEFLAPCLEDFIVKLNMSQALAGITFLALANGAPDIITAVVAGASDSETTALIPFGSLYGAALFSMAFILSVVIFYSKGQKLVLHVRENVVPLLFYIGGTVYLIFISLFYGKMNIVFATIFFSLYIVYLLIVLYEERQKKKIAGNSMLTDKEEGEEQNVEKANKSLGEETDGVYHQIQNQEEKKDEQGKKGFFGKALDAIKAFWRFVFTYTVPVILNDQANNTTLLLAVILSPLVLFITQGVPDVFTDTMFEVPLAFWYSIPSALLLVYMIYNIIKNQKPYYTTVFNIYSFIVIVTWLTLIVNVLINHMELLQLLTNVNPIFLGLTVFAGAASIGDYLSIVAFAKRGYSSTSVSAIFSGQLLNFLIGFGIAKIMKSISDGEHDFNIFDISGSTFDVLSDLIVVIVIAMSVVFMVIMLVVIVIKRGVLENKVRIFTRWFYFGFIGVALAISLLTDFFNQISCDM